MTLKCDCGITKSVRKVDVYEYRGNSLFRKIYHVCTECLEGEGWSCIEHDCKCVIIEGFDKFHINDAAGVPIDTAVFCLKCVNSMIKKSHSSEIAECEKLLGLTVTPLKIQQLSLFARAHLPRRIIRRNPLFAACCLLADIRGTLPQKQVLDIRDGGSVPLGQYVPPLKTPLSEAVSR